MVAVGGAPAAREHVALRAAIPTLSFDKVENTRVLNTRVYMVIEYRSHTKVVQQTSSPARTLVQRELRAACVS